MRSGGKVRVLFVLEDLFCGGGIVSTLIMLRHLDRSKFEPTLFLLKREGVFLSEVPNDVRLITGCGSSKRWYQCLMPYVFAKLLLEARRSDIVVGALELKATYLAYLAGRLARKPVVGWVQAPIHELLKKCSRKHSVVTRHVYPRLTCIVCISKTTRQSLFGAAPVRSEQVRIIHSPYELDSIVKSSNEAVPQWAQAVFSKTTLIAVGRMVHEKGLDLLIKAHAEVLKKGIDHNILIVGPKYPLGKQLRALVRDLGLGKTVFLHNYVENPYPLMRAAIGVVIPSRFEGLCNVMVEALALGKAVVATDCRGPSEVLSDGVNGVLVPTENVDELALGMSQILLDGKLRAALSQKARESVKTFVPENTLPQWERLLIELAQ